MIRFTTRVGRWERSASWSADMLARDAASLRYCGAGTARSLDPGSLKRQPYELRCFIARV